MKPFETIATPAVPEKKEMMEEIIAPEENIVPAKDPEPVATASPDGSLSVNPTALEGMMPCGGGVATRLHGGDDRLRHRDGQSRGRTLYT